MLYIAVGMPRAGSGWHYNLIHDLVVASGGDVSQKIRKNFFLSPILTEVNCNIGFLSPKRLLPSMVPTLFGKNYVIKVHSGPTPIAERFIKNKSIKVAYIYRDPRAALLSALEYGEFSRADGDGRSKKLFEVDTIERAVEFIQEYIGYWEEWQSMPEVLKTRYEDLLNDYDAEIPRLLEFLEIKEKTSAVMAAIAHYRPGQQSKGQSLGMHYKKGQPERFRSSLTPEQLDYCNQELGEAIQKMGYML